MTTQVPIVAIPATSPITIEPSEKVVNSINQLPIEDQIGFFEYLDRVITGFPKRKDRQRELLKLFSPQIQRMAVLFISKETETTDLKVDQNQVKFTPSAEMGGGDSDNIIISIDYPTKARGEIRYRRILLNIEKAKNLTLIPQKYTGTQNDRILQASINVLSAYFQVDLKLRYAVLSPQRDLLFFLLNNHYNLTYQEIGCLTNTAKNTVMSGIHRLEKKIIGNDLLQFNQFIEALKKKIDEQLKSEFNNL